MLSAKAISRTAIARTAISLLACASLDEASHWLNCTVTHPSRSILQPRVRSAASSARHLRRSSRRDHGFCYSVAPHEGPAPRCRKQEPFATIARSAAHSHTVFTPSISKSASYWRTSALSRSVRTAVRLCLVEGIEDGQDRQTSDDLGHPRGSFEDLVCAPNTLARCRRQHRRRSAPVLMGLGRLLGRVEPKETSDVCAGREKAGHVLA